jgi:hypothetical protein
MANWEKIKHEWITGSDDVTFRTLAVRYKAKRTTISKRASRERWMADRRSFRRQARREARQTSLQDEIQGIREGAIQDYSMYEQLIALGLQDVTGRYSDPKDAQRAMKIGAATLLTAIRDRRRLREWVHEEKEPVPDQNLNLALAILNAEDETEKDEDE